MEIKVNLEGETSKFVSDGIKATILTSVMAGLREHFYARR